MDESDTDRFGGDMGPDFKSTLAQCQSDCATTDDCQSIAYNTRSQQYWPKKTVPRRGPAPGFVAGVKVKIDP